MATAPHQSIATVLYVTTPDRECALEIARTLLEERLIACANIWEPMTSVYRWKGKVEQGSETVLWLKSRTDRVERVTARIVALHPYECPCVVAWPIDSGYSGYLDWIALETALDDEGD